MWKFQQMNFQMRRWLYCYFKTVLSSASSTVQQTIDTPCISTKNKWRRILALLFLLWQRWYHAYKDSWATLLDKEMLCQRESGKWWIFSLWRLGREVWHTKAVVIAITCYRKNKNRKFPPMQIVFSWNLHLQKFPVQWQLAPINAWEGGRNLSLLNYS